MNLECNVAYSDPLKSEVLANNKGQTALYWIVTKMPDIVSHLINLAYFESIFLMNSSIYKTLKHCFILHIQSFSRRLFYS